MVIKKVVGLCTSKATYITLQHYRDRLIYNTTGSHLQGGMLRQKSPYSLQEFFLDTVRHQRCGHKMASQSDSSMTNTGYHVSGDYLKG